MPITDANVRAVRIEIDRLEARLREWGAHDGLAAGARARADCCHRRQRRHPPVKYGLDARAGGFAESEVTP